jgi:hypothetical protein
MNVGIDNRAPPQPPRLSKSLCLLRANKQSILCLVCSPIRDFFANTTAHSCHRGRGGVSFTHAWRRRSFSSNHPPARFVPGPSGLCQRCLGFALVVRWEPEYSTACRVRAPPCTVRTFNQEHSIVQNRLRSMETSPENVGFLRQTDQ